jgi:hypothetical protein
LLRQLKRKVVQHEKRLLENFGDGELELFLKLLQKVFPAQR